MCATFVTFLLCNVGKKNQSTALSCNPVINSIDDNDSGMEANVSEQHMLFKLPISCSGKHTNLCIL